MSTTKFKAGDLVRYTRFEANFDLSVGYGCVLNYESSGGKFSIWIVVTERGAEPFFDFELMKEP